MGLLSLLILLSVSTVSIEADTYDTYIYSYWGEAIPSTPAYVPDRVIRGTDVGKEDFVDLSDVVVSGDKTYMVDAGANAIIILNDKWEVIDKIDSFGTNNQDTFNNPRGIFVSHKNRIYVADTDNERIVILGEDHKVLDIITKPETSFLEDLPFVPMKLAVDKADRMYVIAKGIYEGIIELDSGGEFSRFTGVNKVAVNPVDYFWKTVGTKKQKEQMKLYIPTEFRSIDIDPSGFLYTISLPNNDEILQLAHDPIKRINPKGEDVLRREGYVWVIGDLDVPLDERTSFRDVVVDDYGRYSALDKTKGRIFTYDDDGNLLYVFGGLGNQEGTFMQPTALAYGGENILVVDGGNNTMTVFRPTDFGVAVNAATKHQYLGNYKEASAYWHQVSELDSNYDLAYVGIGKSYYRNKQYREACEYFRLGNERKYYGRAYQKYRKEIMRRYFGPVMTGMILLIVLILIWLGTRKRRRLRLS